MHALARVPFDLARGPLVRSTLIRIDDQTHVLVLVMHHIVTDGWSTGVFMRELSMLYRAFASGEPADLPEIDFAYTDYARWQREQVQGERLEQELAYWRGQLEDAGRHLQAIAG